MFVRYTPYNILILDTTIVVEVFIAAIGDKNTMPVINRSKIDQLCMHDQ